MKLSQRITSEQDLRELGTNVLKVAEHVIDTALNTYRNSSINNAAHDVLSTWRKQQPSGQEAYMDLQAGLKRAKMNQLAAQLRKWVEGIDDPSQISSERKLLKLPLLLLLLLTTSNLLRKNAFLFSVPPRTRKPGILSKQQIKSHKI